jgi:hypothetical protein
MLSSSKESKHHLDSRPTPIQHAMAHILCDRGTNVHSDWDEPIYLHTHSNTRCLSSEVHDTTFGNYRIRLTNTNTMARTFSLEIYSQTRELPLGLHMTGGGHGVLQQEKKRLNQLSAPSLAVPWSQLPKSDFLRRTTKSKLYAQFRFLFLSNDRLNKSV